MEWTATLSKHRWASLSDTVGTADAEVPRRGDDAMLPSGMPCAAVASSAKQPTTDRVSERAVGFNVGRLILYRSDGCCHPPQWHTQLTVMHCPVSDDTSGSTEIDHSETTTTT